MRRHHFERHYNDRIGWLRAAVLGANDGIVSTASLIVGVVAAGMVREDVLLTAVAGLVAGAMSMAAGEYVSVSSQSDIEEADLRRERHELETDAANEHDELAHIYVGRGLDLDLAHKVAEQLMAHDALAAHARDELGITLTNKARPIQAALTSAISFAAGAAMPTSLVLIAPMNQMNLIIAICTLLFLATLGAVAAKTGGASLVRGAVRVTFWGSLAMAATAAIGHLFGAVV